MEVDGVSKALPVPKTTGLSLDPLNPAVHALRMSVVALQNYRIQDATTGGV